MRDEKTLVECEELREHRLMRHEGLAMVKSYCQPQAQKELPEPIESRVVKVGLITLDQWAWKDIPEMCL